MWNYLFLPHGCIDFTLDVILSFIRIISETLPIFTYYSHYVNGFGVVWESPASSFSPFWLTSKTHSSNNVTYIHNENFLESKYLRKYFQTNNCRNWWILGWLLWTIIFHILIFLSNDFPPSIWKSFHQFHFSFHKQIHSYICKNKIIMLMIFMLKIREQ